MIFRGDNYYLDWDLVSGRAITYYPNGHWTGVDVIPDDHYHAKRLDCLPQVHRLAHELIHHLIGRYYYKQDGSPVLYRSAHHKAQPARLTELEEWMVTAWTYKVFGKPHDEGAIMDLAKEVNIEDFMILTRWLLVAPLDIKEIKL